MHNKQYLTRLLALSAIALAAGSAVAHEETAPASTMSDQVVVKDAATGQLRGATQEEMMTLQARRAVMQAQQVRLHGAPAAAAPMAKVHAATNARGVRVTDEQMSHNVVVRMPDGSLRADCVEAKSPEEALAQAQKAAAKNAPATE